MRVFGCDILPSPRHEARRVKETGIRVLGRAGEFVIVAYIEASTEKVVIDQVLRVLPGDRVA